jgi:hypothetical protein
MRDQPRVDHSAEATAAAGIAGGANATRKIDATSRAALAVPVNNDADAAWNDLFFWSPLSVLVSKIITAPFETIKDVQQLGATGVSIAPPNGRFPLSFSGVAKHIFYHHGITGLCGGVAIAFFKFFPSASVGFALRDALRTHARAGDSRVSRYFKRVVPDILAASLTVVILHPLEVARTRAALRSAGVAIPMLHLSFRELISKHGIATLFCGTAASALGVVLYRMLYFAGYDATMELLRKYKVIDNPNLSRRQLELLRFAAAQAVCIAAMSVCYPLSTIVTRQVADPVHSLSLVDCAHEIIREEGVSALFAGLPAAALRSFVASFASLVVDKLRLQYAGRGK